MSYLGSFWGLHVYTSFLVAALFMATKETSGNRDTILAMEYAFGAPRKSVEFYEADDSGILYYPTYSRLQDEARRSHLLHHS